MTTPSISRLRHIGLGALCLLQAALPVKALAVQYQYQEPAPQLVTTAPSVGIPATTTSTPPLTTPAPPPEAPANPEAAAPPVIPVFTLSAGLLNFGVIPAGEAATALTVLAENSGTVPLELPVIATSGAGFSASHNCASTLSVSADCLITVRFFPESVATYAGLMTVAYSNTAIRTVTLQGSARAIAPTIGAFVLPAAVFGSTPPALVPPASNSAGQITFTSSDPRVATVQDATLTLQGVGTTTITAVQAAHGLYTAASSSATLTVSGQVPLLGRLFVPHIAINKTYLLTTPSSNSTGAFTYSSSNPAVLAVTPAGELIAGSTPGTVTITATQAAAGNFAAATTTTFLIVFDPATVIWVVLNTVNGEGYSALESA